MPMHRPATPRALTNSDAVERILAAAKTLFAEQGFDAVSMNAIAERAGVSKANIFHHFTSKNDLYVAVLHHVCRDASERLDDLDKPNAPFEERLEQFARSHLKTLLDHGQMMRLLLREMLSDNPRLGQELAEQVYGEKFSRFVAILRAGQAAGELRTDVDPAMVATLLIGADVFFFEAREVLNHFPDAAFSRKPERFSAMLADILLRGILPPEKNIAKPKVQS